MRQLWSHRLRRQGGSERDGARFWIGDGFLASFFFCGGTPQSPVAEKVRGAFGIKGLAWRKVEIPRLPPKPMLTALTGGYRRTPVMQIGADIYCDSQRIIRELERRLPSPTFMPTSDQGLMWSLSRWTDGALFDQTVRHILGAAGDQLDKDFAADRGRLFRPTSCQFTRMNAARLCQEGTRSLLTEEWR